MKRYTITRTMRIDGVKYPAGAVVDADEVAASLASMLQLGQCVECDAPAAALLAPAAGDARDAEIARLREKLAEYDRERDDAADGDPALRDRAAARAEIERLRGELAALTAVKPPEAPAEPPKPADPPEVAIKPGELLTLPADAQATLVGPPGEPPATTESPKPEPPKHKNNRR